MSRYDGLIIPRSYSEYINKTDAATLSQALQLGGVLDSAPTEDSRGGVRSGGVFDALAGKQPTLTFDDTPTEDSDNPVKSGGIYDALEGKVNTNDVVDSATNGNLNPITSNAAYNHIFVDYSQNLYTGTSASTWTATEDCFVSLCLIGNTSFAVQANGKDVLCSDSTGGYCVATMAGFYKKGTVFTANTSVFSPSRFKAFRVY